MELRHIRHFLAVAQTLNFSRAAENLNISASPLSRSIQQFESELGGALFIRATRKVELTPLGLSLLPYASRILENVDEMQREARRRIRGHVELNVGIRSVPPELTRALIDEVIHEIEPTADVRLEPLDSFVQMDQIVSGRLAFGLVNRRSEDRRLDYLAVLREEPGMALPDEPKYSRLTSVSPGDLDGLRLLAQPGADPTAPQLAEYLRNIREVVPVSSDIIGGIPAIIAEGGSCCLTLANPSAPWHKYLAGDGVVIRPLHSAAEHAITYLCWRVNRDRDSDLGPILELARKRFVTPLDL
ncbi:LysR family transcriptional regulator [Subtercola endophyticus]|uniref:LysR family transcriptional regulator n=1 Tax=Subtercola endophyticus TaxID=2895559 RepID=UPI001E2B1747|nr:LysR family transcriptional regulator [Subtercola endophyticus]UFS58739.1 LysR family transcriptional regulator [Subtercola endophyticus]